MGGLTYALRLRAGTRSTWHYPALHDDPMPNDMPPSVETLPLTTILVPAWPILFPITPTLGGDAATDGAAARRRRLRRRNGGYGRVCSPSASGSRRPALIQCTMEASTGRRR